MTFLNDLLSVGHPSPLSSTDLILCAFSGLRKYILTLCDASPKVIPQAMRTAQMPCSSSTRKLDYLGLGVEALLTHSAVRDHEIGRFAHYIHYIHRAFCLSSPRSSPDFGLALCNVHPPVSWILLNASWLSEWSENFYESLLSTTTCRLMPEAWFHIGILTNVYFLSNRTFCQPTSSFTFSVDSFGFRSNLVADPTCLLGCLCGHWSTVKSSSRGFLLWYWTLCIVSRRSCWFGILPRQVFGSWNTHQWTSTSHLIQLSNHVASQCRTLDD